MRIMVQTGDTLHHPSDLRTVGNVLFIRGLYFRHYDCGVILYSGGDDGINVVDRHSGEVKDFFPLRKVYSDGTGGFRIV